LNTYSLGHHQRLTTVFVLASVCMLGAPFSEFINAAKSPALGLVSAAFAELETTIALDSKQETAGALMLKRGDPAKKEIAITIDDGPYESKVKGLGTKAVLAALEETGVKATFFVLGEQAKLYPHLVKAIQSAGHSIGNHTLRHKSFPALSPQDQVKEIVGGRQAILDALGDQNYSIRSFRLMGGNGFLDKTINLRIGRYHEFNCFWTIDTNDWRGWGEQSTVNTVMNSSMLNGAIVLMHDTAQSYGTANAIRRIVPALKAKGFRFVTIEELSKK